MIKVLFDHQKFSTQRYGGITRYFANIIEGIKTEQDFSYQIGCLYSPNFYIRNESIFLNNAFGRRLFDSRLRNRIYSVNQKYCERLLKGGNFDVFHPTYYDSYFIGRTKKPVVVTIHDMTHERFPEYFWAQDTLTRNKRLNIEAADKIIAISETTKADLLTYSNVDPSKIEVIYHGIETELPAVIEDVPEMPSSYFLYVGDRSGYKNFYRFLDAFKKLSEKYKDIHVILAGGGALARADREVISRLRLQDRIKHLHVSDGQLNYLYKNSIAFVYPSLHEGFGLGILEAFRVGCPVILSDTPCFREIGADAVNFFDTYDVDSQLASMEKLLTEDGYRSELIERGYKRLLDFELKTSLNQTYNVYKSLI